MSFGLFPFTHVEESSVLISFELVFKKSIWIVPAGI